MERDYLFGERIHSWLRQCVSVGALITSLFVANVAHASNALGFEQALQQAMASDLLSQAHARHRDSALSAGKAADWLPNPKIGVKLQNIPVGDWSLEQDNMTQVRFGFSQTIPRGDTLSLTANAASITAEFASENHKLRNQELRRVFSRAWLELVYWTKIRALIVDNRHLFSRLLDITESQYGVGDKNLTDVVRVELELTNLDVRLASIDVEIAKARAGLAEWLPQLTDQALMLSHYPAIGVPQQWLSLSLSDLSKALRLHPAISRFDTQIKHKDNAVKLAEQAFKPEWTVEAGYGYRQDNEQGVSRDDLFTIGISVDMPLFSDQKQRYQLNQRQYQLEAEKLQFQQFVQQQAAMTQQTQQMVLRLQDKRALYADKLLKQTEAQADATLSAFTVDAGSFADVIRAYIMQLDTVLAFETINKELLTAAIELHYYLSVPSAEQLPGTPYVSFPSLLAKTSAFYEKPLFGMSNTHTGDSDE